MGDGSAFEVHIDHNKDIVEKEHVTVNAESSINPPLESLKVDGKGTYVDFEITSSSLNQGIESLVQTHDLSVLY